MKNKKIVLILGTILLIAIGGCSLIGEEEQQVEEEKVEAIAVEIDTVMEKDISLETFAMGQLSAEKVYNVMALASGDVVQVNYDIGDKVNKDDVLFVLDNEDFKESKDNQLKQLNISKQQAKISLDNAKQTYEDNLKLYESGSISKLQLDNSKLQYEQAKLQYDNVINQIETTMDNLENQEENLEIKSPVNGIVTNRNIEQDMFATNQNGFTIIQNDPIIFKAGVVEQYINKIEIGQAARVNIPALNIEVSGIVKNVSITKQGNTYPVEIAVDNPDLLLKPGMYAEVNITYDRVKDALCVPREAVLDEGGTKYVYVLGEKEGDFYKVTKELIKVIDSREELVRIDNQDLLGKEVITRGNIFIKPDSLVNID